VGLNTLAFIKAVEKSPVFLGNFNFQFDTLSYPLNYRTSLGIGMRHKIIKIIFALGLFIAAVPLTAKSDQATLDCARQIAGQDQNFTYGTNVNQIDCVHFVLAVVNCRLGAPVSAEAEKAILIAYGWTGEETQSKAKEGTDPHLAGVQFALTQILNQGTVINPAQAKPGDLIQYWMERSNGTWFGHSGVIASVHGMRAKILSASETNNAIAETPLNLTGPNRHLYVVRLGE
jgi:hypothetical protein